MFKLQEVHEPEEAADGIEQFMVPMRDGVHLATDVYLPKTSGKHVAILVRTCYDKNSRYTALKQQAQMYAEHGYVFVTQDVRGKFRSEGETVPYVHDVDDAYDTIEWIIAQPWSNGRVGLTGDSYYGYTAWAGVACGHPAIGAAIPRVCAVDMGHRHTTAGVTRDIGTLISINDLVQIWTDNRGYLVEMDYAHAKPLDLIDAARQQLGKSIAGDRLASTITKPEGWFSPYGARHPYHTTEIPILHWVSWHDFGLAPGGMKDWRMLRANPGRRHLHYLRAASADHAGFQLEDVGNPDAHPYVNDDALMKKLTTECADEFSFFDEHLRGIVPETPRPRAKWHLGHAGWQTSTEFPPTESRTQTLYLGKGSAHRGPLLTTRQDAASSMTWQHDPHNPVPSTTSIEEVWYYLAAWPDEQHMAERDDVMTFTSEVLTADVDVAGQPVFRVDFESTAPNAHIFVKLQDVEPSGVTRQVSRGECLVAQNRNEPLVLPLNDLGHRFKAGHRIQLQIQSSDFPYFLVHPGTADNPWIAENFAISTQSVKVGGEAGASLTLPIFTPAR